MHCQLFIFAVLRKGKLLGNSFLMNNFFPLVLHENVTISCWWSQVLRTESLDSCSHSGKNDSIIGFAMQRMNLLLDSLCDLRWHCCHTASTMDKSATDGSCLRPQGSSFWNKAQTTSRWPLVWRILNNQEQSKHSKLLFSTSWMLPTSWDATIWNSPPGDVQGCQLEISLVEQILWWQEWNEGTKIVRTILSFRIHQVLEQSNTAAPSFPLAVFSF